MKLRTLTFLLSLSFTLIALTAAASACGSYFFIVEDGKEVVVYDDLGGIEATSERSVYQTLAEKTAQALLENPQLDTQGMVQEGPWGW